MSETPGLGIAHLGGWGNGGWRGALQTAQRQAPLRGERLCELDSVAEKRRHSYGCTIEEVRASQTESRQDTPYKMPTEMSEANVKYFGPSLTVRDWDIVLTCFEPLNEVTGGIGTYHKLLIDVLAANGHNILVLTRSVNEKWLPPPGATVLVVDHFRTSKPYNFVGLDHEQFSLKCHFAFRALFEAGHRFKFVEFSDYGGDGFYSLRARAAGVYDLGISAVRLHSPNVMLVQDNGKKHSQLSEYLRDVIDREMSAYEDCDIILYGGEAMRERVCGLAQKFGHDLSAKTVKCPHPYPKHLFCSLETADDINRSREAAILTISRLCNGATREELTRGRIVGIFGRIEDRKGQYQFLSALLSDESFTDYLKRSDIHFLIAGHNVLDHVGRFRLADLYNIIHQHGLSNRFHFTGRVPQETLKHFSRAVSGYIFPSIFENYPNALLEVLPTTKPIAISSHGCMPEITDRFSGITIFDPTNLNVSDITSFLRTLQRPDADIDRTEFEKRFAALEARQSKLLERYSLLRPIAQGEAAVLQSVGYVVPIYQEWRYLDETLQSISCCMQPGDEVVVVDDASEAANFAIIEEICAQRNVTLLRLNKNSGPNAARFRGVQQLQTDLIQFCDADDILSPAGITHSRASFSRDPDVTMVTGIMDCFQDAAHYWVPRNGHIWTEVTSHHAHSGSMFRMNAISKALSVAQERIPINEDWLTSLLILAHGGKSKMIPVTTYRYRRFDGTRSTKNVSLSGSVLRYINSKAFENWNFGSAAENSRLREMLVMGAAELTSNSDSISPSEFPLRYRIVDAVFFRAIRIPIIERAAIAIKKKIMSLKSGNYNVQ